MNLHRPSPLYIAYPNSREGEVGAVVTIELAHI